MRKLFMFAVAALVMLATSCAKDEVSDVQMGDMDVTFSVALPDATRSIGDGLTADKLYVSVFNEGHTEQLSALNKTAVQMTNGTAQVTLRLVSGKKYDIVFWAQAAGAPYAFDHATGKMTVNNYTSAANDENRDAFYAFVDDYTASNGGSKSVTLTRPFAQLNVATADFEQAKDAGVVVAQTKVKVTGVYSTLNLFTGAVEGSAVDAEFALASFPTEQFSAEHKTWLSMNYLLVNQKVLSTVTMTTDKADVEAKVWDNVPLQRNYRTNILGNILTAENDFSIEVDEAFTGTFTENHVTATVDTAGELQDAINSIGDGGSGEITLDGDIDLSDLAGLLSTRAETSNFITIAKDKTITLNLNGCTLKGVDKTEKNFGLIQNNGNLTVKNLGDKQSRMELSATVNSGWNRYSAVISNNPGATLTVEGDIVIEHKGGTDMAYGIDQLTNGTIGDVMGTINGATIKSTYRAVRQFLNSDNKMNTLVVKAGSTIEGSADSEKSGVFFHDPSTKANLGTLNIENGADVTGVYLFVTAGSTMWPVDVKIAESSIRGGHEVVSANVPEGYALVVNGNGTWSVVEGAKVMNAAEFIAAVAAVEDGATIVLGANVNFSDVDCTPNGGDWYEGIYYIGDKDFTIDLNGYTISNPDNAVNDYLILIKNDGEKANTISFENGTIDAGTSAYCALCTSTTSTQQITINLENVELINNNSNGSVVKIRGGSVLNVNDGTVITGKDSYLGIENAAATVNIYDGAEIYMNGTSSYNGSLVGVGYNGTINVYGGYGKGTKGGFIAMTSGGTINISGGEWIANTDGTYANDNKSVLIAQNDKNTYPNAGKSIVNVTGGTFKGGYNCYGYTVDTAYINISGGNFNSNPTDYVVEGKSATESNGTWNVQ